MSATLRGTQLFADLPAVEIEEVAAFCQLRTLAKEELLFREGERPEGFYVVQSGSINVHRSSAGGREQVIAIFRPGESFAEAALAGGHCYPASARAIEASAVLLVPRDPFVVLLGRKPELSLRMLAAMSVHLHALVNRVEDMNLRDVETRLLNWLLKRCDASAPGLQVVELDTTKRVLAAELSTSSETLSRTFARLRDDGLLKVEGPQLEISDAAALRRRFTRLLGEQG